jgi:hypothetical protein
VTVAKQPSAFAYLLNAVAQLSRHEEKVREITGERFNIFEIVRIGHYEVSTHSPMLAELLDPKGRHGQGSRFLELFLQSPLFARETGNGSEGLASIARERLPDPRTATVLQETSLGELGRVDITIGDKRGRTLIIENKIYAGDQEGQVSRYLSDQRAPVVVYLTLRGDPPSAYSFDPNAAGAEEKKPRLIRASYQTDILDWLEACRKEVPTVAQVRESLTQYIQLIKRLTGQNPSQHMANEIFRMISKDRELFLAYTKLKNAYPAVRKSILDQISNALTEAGAKVGLRKTDDLLGNGKSGENIFFTNDFLSSNNLKVGFRFGNSDYRGLHHGFAFIDHGKNCPISLRITEAFKKDFGVVSSNPFWCAFAYSEQIHSWDDEVLSELLFADSPTILLELLERLSAVGKKASEAFSSNSMS